MKTSFSSLLSFLLVAGASVSVSGLKFPIQKRSAQVSASSVSSASVVQANDNIDNIDNTYFTTTIQLNGKDVTVILDTGSSDLWVMPQVDLGEVEEKDIKDLIINYGQGSVSGTVALTSLELASYHVSEQAILLVEETTLTALSKDGVQGLLGLGISQANSSKIQEAVVDKYGPSATWGATVLQSIFASQPDTRDFISISLHRTDDLEGTGEGTFLIGEHDEDHPDIGDMPHLSKFPADSNRWTVVLEKIIVDDVEITLTSTIPGTPSGQAVALIDSGTPTGYLPSSVIKEIYSGIPGAVFYENSNIWLVPCSASIAVELVFAGKKYPINPLDVTKIVSPVYANGNNYTTCVNSFIGDDNAGGTEFDIAFGASFLLNVVAEFDYGGNEENAFIQIISITDKTEAVKDFKEVRTSNLVGLPQELDPSALIALLDTTTGGQVPRGDNPKIFQENPDGTPIDDDDEEEDDGEFDDDDEEDDDGEFDDDDEEDDDGEFDDDDEEDDDGEFDDDDEEDDDGEFDDDDEADDDGEFEDDAEDDDDDNVAEENPDGTPFTSGNQSSRINADLADNSGSSTSSIDHYAPAILGLLAANLLVGLGLVALAIVTCVRRGAKAGTPRGPRSQGAYAAVGESDEATPGYGQYQKPYDSAP